MQDDYNNLMRFYSYICPNPALHLVHLLPGEHLLHLEENQTGCRDDIETVDTVPEWDMEPDTRVLVAEHVGSTAHPLQQDAQQDGGLPLLTSVSPPTTTTTSS